MADTASRSNPGPAEGPAKMRRALRCGAGAALAMLGLALALGWPFEPVLEDPGPAHGALLALGAWFFLAGAAFAMSGFGGRWRRWPWRHPRIRALRWAAGFTAVVLLPLGSAFGGLLATVAESNVGDLEFANELAVPELLEPYEDAQGRRVFDLNLQRGQHSFLPGTTTETLGANGEYLGPTLRAERGDTVRINVGNGIGEPTTMHWHGMHLPAAADGGPHQRIGPGETWSPEWTIDQPAGSLWYHPHPHGATGEHVYRGLAGLFIVDDAESGALELPDRYGVDDIPLIVQDRRFADDGTLAWDPAPLSSLGVLGDEILVNGTHDPYLTVDRTLVRLRILNGSNNRSFDFGFSDERPFRQIAGDGGLLEAPHHTRRVMLSPGERAELVVAFEPGDDTVLRSFPPRTGAFPERRVGGADRFDILRIRAEEELEPSPGLPDHLADIERLAPENPGPDRRFELGDSVINGREMDMGRIDHVVAAGETEVWEVANTDQDPHNFHVHDKHFQVLSVDGRPPAPGLAGWKDTVFVPPGSTVRLAIRFGRHTDPEIPYMFHCHLLTHEDEGMMGQFTVVEPGTEEEAPRRIAVPEEHGRHGRD